MATISLYSKKINQMPSLISDVKKSVSDFKTSLSSFKIKASAINKSVCDLDDVISSIQSSTQTQEDKITSLETLQKNTVQFINDTNCIDNDVADVIKSRKDDFYEKYSYLKPDCEKSWLEQRWEDCKSALKTAGEWCKEHWKLIVTVILVIAAVVIIVVTAGTALGPLSVLLVAVAKGIIIGATIGGLVGGTISAITGGSFFEGFEDGAFSGAISGAITGGMGSWMSSGAGATLSLSKTVLIGAIAETGASLLGDIGDIAIKGEDISFGDVAFNAAFSFALGAVFSAGGHFLANKLPLKISGINKGTGSWAHVWASQSTRSLRHGTKVSMKTILKGLGADAVGGVWDYACEIFKGGIDTWKDSWDFIPQN